MPVSRLKIGLAARSISMMLLALSCCGCVSYGGKGLIRGKSTMHDVLQYMGVPAMQWQNPDGTTQLIYPRGPVGYNTFMVSIGKDQKLRHIEDVLHPGHFSLIKPGMTKDQVLHILGPSEPSWTIYFGPPRNEFEWEWRYCNGNREASRFTAIFDRRKDTVRSTIQQAEDCGEEKWRCRCP